MIDLHGFPLLCPNKHIQHREYSRVNNFGLCVQLGIYIIYTASVLRNDSRSFGFRCTNARLTEHTAAIWRDSIELEASHGWRSVYTYLLLLVIGRNRFRLYICGVISIIIKKKKRVAHDFSNSLMQIRAMLTPSSVSFFFFYVMYIYMYIVRTISNYVFYDKSARKSNSADSSEYERYMYAARRNFYELIQFKYIRC